MHSYSSQYEPTTGQAYRPARPLPVRLRRGYCGWTRPVGIPPGDFTAAAGRSMRDACGRSMCSVGTRLYGFRAGCRRARSFCTASPIVNLQLAHRGAARAPLVVHPVEHLHA